MDELIEGISDLLEDTIRDRKLRWIVALPNSVLPVLAVAGFALNKTQGAIIVLLLAVLTLVGSVVVLALSRKYMRRELHKSAIVLNRYADAIRVAQEGDPHYFETEQWAERLNVTKRGDARIVKDFTLKAGPKGLGAIWTLIYRNSDAHMDKATTARVRIAARFLNDDGQVGTRIVTTHRFEANNALRIFFHFQESVAPGAQIKLRLIVEWPKYFSDALDGTTERNTWVFRRVSQKMTHRLTLDRGFAPYGVAVSRIGPSVLPKIEKEYDSGATVILFSVDSPEVGVHYGFTLDVKERDQL